MSISFSARVRANDGVLLQEVQGEIMFLNMATESYLGLDRVGSRMFQLLATADSIQAAYTTLLQEYDVDGDRLRTDLDDLITKLVDNGLVKIEHA